MAGFWAGAGSRLTCGGEGADARCRGGSGRGFGDGPSGRGWHPEVWSTGQAYARGRSCAARRRIPPTSPQWPAANAARATPDRVSTGRNSVGQRGTLIMAGVSPAPCLLRGEPACHPLAGRLPARSEAFRRIGPLKIFLEPTININQITPTESGGVFTPLTHLFEVCLTRVFAVFGGGVAGSGVMLAFF